MTTDRPNPDPNPEQPAAGGPGPYPGQNPAYGQPAAGSRYGTQPYAAPGYGAQPGSPYGVVPEPAAFPALLTLTLTSLALYVLSSLPALFGGEESIERMRDSLRQSGLTPEQVEEIAPVVGASVTVGTIIVLLIGVALYALVYFNLRGAKNWARILGIVVAILGTLSAVGGIFSFVTFPGIGGVLASVLSLALVIVNILWLVKAFNPQVAAYTRQGRRA